MVLCCHITMKQKRNKKEWKWTIPRGGVKKDLFSGKYKQRIVEKKPKLEPTIKEELDEYYQTSEKSDIQRAN